MRTGTIVCASHMITGMGHMVVIGMITCLSHDGHMSHDCCLISLLL